MRRWLGFLGSAVFWGVIVVAVTFPRIGRPLMTALLFGLVLWFVRYILLGEPPPKWFGNVVQPLAIGRGTRWRVSVGAVALCLVFPVILVILVTSGGSGSAAMAAFGHYYYGKGAAIMGEMVCLAGIVTLVVVVPEWLRVLGRAWRDGSPVPGWLAGFAAVFTVGYVLALHFDRHVLPSSHPGVLFVTGFGVAVLLAPFYRIVATTCWQRGVEVVFDPVQWWLSWRTAWREVISSPGDGAGGESGAVGEDADGLGQSVGPS
jgi:hypothetical protein